eukprot:g39987.t1
MTPYASDLPAKDLVKLFEMQSQEQQKKEREAKEKKALRVKRVAAEKAKEKLAAMKDISEGFEEERQSYESDAEGEKKNETEGEEEEDVKKEGSQGK